MANKTRETNAILEEGKYKVIGTNPIRHDGVDKVTGRAAYGADINPSGLLHGKLLRSPHAHAIIKSIDTTVAESMEGVKGVVTYLDLPDTDSAELADYGLGPMNLKYIRENVLASRKVLYVGHAVAGIAADNPHIAEEALKSIKVEYEILPSVTNASKAMNEDAPILHEDLRTQKFGSVEDGLTNVSQHYKHKLGDIDKAFNDSHVIIEKEFNTSMIHQGYIEPMNVTAFWNKDGRIHIWTSTQGPFEVRRAMAICLNIGVSKIKVIPMEIGGGFGGKFPLYHEPVAALLSKITGNPVKIVMTRKEVFQGTGPTSGSYLKVKMGVDRAGNFTAAQAYMAYEAGAFPGSPVDIAAQYAFAAYNIPNIMIDGYDVVVNKPKAGAYRAPGATNAAFAIESVVDELSVKLNMDPLQFRMKNVADEHTRSVTGLKYPSVGRIEVLEAMMNHPHWKTPLSGTHYGRGVAVGYWPTGGAESSCTISVNTDGTINLVEGSTDIGGTRASVAMQAAELLGMKAEDVNPQVSDTDSIGYTSGTGGSSVTFKTGLAAYKAAESVLEQMMNRVGLMWNVNPESIQFNDHTFTSTDAPGKHLDFKQVASEINNTGGPILGRASINATGSAPTFAGCLIDVNLDVETGKVEVSRVTIFQDVGKAIHPSYVEGQMQGGIVQGIGWALNEEYFMDAANDMANSTLLDYRIPTCLDLPMIDTVIVEVPNPGHPFGVRGVGEVSIIPPAAAIANAVYRAAGIRPNTLPMNPNVIMENLWQSDD